MSSAYRKAHTRRQQRSALTGGMSSFTPPARRERRRRRPTVLAVLVVVAALTGVLGGALSTGASSATPPSVAGPAPQPSSEHLGGDVPGDLPGSPQREHRDPLGAADGELPDGVTVFDDEHAGLANLDPALRGALRRAAQDADAEGLTLYVNSGWRSPAYQEQLLAEAVSRYGSVADAARWVATPATSPHVSGDAVDIENSAATTWLSEHGAQYGLCQIYRNEPWHFELRADAVDHGCPAVYADPSHDPRMER